MTNIEMLDRILRLHLTALMARRAVDAGNMLPPDNLILFCDAVTMTLKLLVAKTVEENKGISLKEELKSRGLRRCPNKPLKHSPSGAKRTPRA